LTRHERPLPATANNGHDLNLARRLRELVVCSLEAWDEVWRRNQFLVDELLRRNPLLRVLFVEPAADPLFDLRSRRLPALPRYRNVTSDGRLKAFRPLKPLPRWVGGIVDGALLEQVLLAIRAVGFREPVLWVNDFTYAPLIERTGWPSLYDVTDDWLLAPASRRELERRRRLDELALALADEVVVCSRTLAASRGKRRPVSLIPNGVDVEHFQRPRRRPRDLPDAPVAVYVGTLHESRLDVDLVVELARELRQLDIILIGPDALDPGERQALKEHANIRVLGARPYQDVPGYLQHADVIIVPHRVTPFTESLDPIKAYECLAVETPAVATPVAGFRDLEGALEVVHRRRFVDRVRDVLTSGRTSARNGPIPPLWSDRADSFEGALRRAHDIRGTTRLVSRRRALRRALVARLPVPVRRAVRAARREARAAALAGRAVECPVCRSRFRRLVPFSGGRDHACPRCSSLARHRRTILFLRRSTTLYSQPARVLHVAPEHGLRRELSRLPHIDYVTADLLADDVMTKMDITAIDYPDESFDVILCSHVLEHVLDDRRAMRELRRVLRADGWALINVPSDPDRSEVYEDASIVSPLDRLRHFGQEDHVRVYSTDGFLGRLREAGFAVEIDPFNFGGEDRRRYVLDDDGWDHSYLCRRVAGHVASER
jgi:teichuronic acid biosynthesis glycosyltransferase TuaH